MKSLFERINLIHLIASVAVMTGFKVEGILYGMQPQPCQPFFIPI